VLNSNHKCQDLINSDNSNIQYSIDAGQTFHASNTFSDLTAGNYKVIIKSNNTCTTVEMVNLNPAGTNLSSPDVENIEVCYGNSDSFTASSTNVEWYNSYMNYLSTGNSYSPNETEVGIYTYYAMISQNNCQSEITGLGYTIHALPGASFLFGNELEKCKYDTILVALHTTASNITWSPSDGLSSATTNNPELFVQTTTNYQITATDDNSCVSSTGLDVNVLAAPDKPTLNGPSTACYNEQDVLYTTIDDKKNQINWKINGGILSSFSNDSVYAHWTLVGDNGSLKVYLTEPNNGCNSPSELISITKKRYCDK